AREQRKCAATTESQKLTPTQHGLLFGMFCFVTPSEVEGQQKFLRTGARVVIESDAPQSVREHRYREANDGRQQTDGRIEMQRTLALPEEIRCRKVVHESKRDHECENHAHGAIVDAER